MPQELHQKQRDLALQDWEYNSQHDLKLVCSAAQQMQMTGQQDTA
jgi:hypothetical protein